MAYPDLITIAGIEHKAQRNENEVLIPYTEEPDVGTDHPNMLTLKVENMTENAHNTNQSNLVVNIGAISGNQHNFWNYRR